MHRTTTTATLLVTVAVSALSGCVTVHRPLAPGPATAPSQGSEPRPVGGDETEVVQAPAREALEMIGPSRPSKTPASPSHRAAPRATPERDTPPDDRNGQARSARPGTGGNGRPRLPATDLPDVPESMRRGSSGGTDVCALGRRYGGWRPGSPEAAICEKTYGG
ncbi:hypothetical protein ACIA6T_33665 [Streptomyces sp. NPDC051740]|uniref:hypothetical protein n=1 Tax=Streptomyces sp. NPDC051740 TaxID=3365673 RepID=UPI0037912053